MATFKFKGKNVKLNLKPGTLYRLAKAGYSVPDSFLQPDTAILSAVEMLRICSKTDLSSEEVADALADFEPLTKALSDLLGEEEAQAENAPKEGTPEGNVS